MTAKVCIPIACVSANSIYIPCFSTAFNHTYTYCSHLTNNLLTATKQKVSTFKNGYNKYAIFCTIHKGERQKETAIFDSERLYGWISHQTLVKYWESWTLKVDAASSVTIYCCWDSVSLKFNFIVAKGAKNFNSQYS
jgi:hypothetical protein